MRIAIAGFGLEGKVSYQYFSDLYPDAEVTIVDERLDVSQLSADALSKVGEGVFGQLDGYDLVVRTAGLSPYRIKTDGKIWSATNEFFAKCPAKIIGVTGTKGKGTTSSLIASILRQSGYQVHLVGNIGVPSLEVLPQISADDIVVYELSSFQLWDLEISPHIAVVLMIETDHLDVHTSFDDYVEAKSHITSHQEGSDIVIYHPANKYSQAIAERSAGRKIRYQLPDDGGVYEQSNKFFIQESAICGAEALQIVGRHNYDNAAAAITASLQFEQVTNQSIERGLRGFHGLDHRLKYVNEVAGVKFYDDSIATTPGSAIAALRSFDEPKVLIVGGHDKGADYSQLAQCVQSSSSVRGVVLIGSNHQKLHESFMSAGVGSDLVINLGLVDMESAVSSARTLAKPGDVVVLSPAAASFDQYKSYNDRGEQFIQAVGGQSP